METFAKESELGKLLQRLKSTPVLYNIKSSLVFFVCLQWQICGLGALLRDNL